VNFDGLQLISALNVESKDWAKEALSRLSEASLGRFFRIERIRRK
jgi:hypothetical protein